MSTPTNSIPLADWSLADLIAGRSLCWRLRRYDDADALTAELRRRGFTA